MPSIALNAYMPPGTGARTRHSVAPALMLARVGSHALDVYCKAPRQPRMSACARQAAAVLLLVWVATRQSLMCQCGGPALPGATATAMARVLAEFLRAQPYRLELFNRQGRGRRRRATGPRGCGRADRGRQCSKAEQLCEGVPQFPLIIALAVPLHHLRVAARAAMLA